MIHNFFMRRIGCIGGLLLITSAILLPAQSDDTDRILVLHSYNTDFQWTRDIDSGIRDGLLHLPDRRVQLRYEYLDTKHESSAEHLELIAEELQAKYRDTSMDGIIAVDNHALQFLKERRDVLFGPVPTVFTGINGFSEELIAGMDSVTGVVEEISIRETLSMIPMMLPPPTRLYIITANTLTAQTNLELTLQIIRTLEWAPEVVVLDDPRPSNLLEISANEEAGTSAAILVGSVMDEAGRRMDFAEAARYVPELLSSIPVFTLWDFYVGYGIVGGRVTYGRSHGTAAAELMRSVLDGADADTLPIVDHSPNEWLFDSEALARFGIPEYRLPEGATLLNYTPSAWQLYRLEITVGVASILLLSIALVSIAVTAQFRKDTNRRLEQSLEEKRVLLREVHHRVKNSLQVISSILHMQGQRLQDEKAIDYFIDCDSRIRSMALVHEQLYQSTSLAEIKMNIYLTELVDTVSSLMAKSAPRSSIETDFDEIRLDLDTAIPVGLLVNELTSNAFKYGSRETDEGRQLELHVAMKSREVLDFSGASQAVVLEVTDTGEGMDEGTDTSDSLGLQLVEALTSQLRGTITYEDANPGLIVRITFPVPGQAVPSKSRRRQPASGRTNASPATAGTGSA